MSATEFHLPGSRVEEIEKIVEAYGQRNEPSSNPEIAQLTGLNKETVSRNNKFLISVGIIEGGRRKQATDLGRRLGRALKRLGRAFHPGEAGEVRRHWQEAMITNKFLSEQIRAVRVQKGIKVEALPRKILDDAQAAKTQASETGARALVHILVRAGLLEVSDDTYRVAKGSSPPSSPKPKEPEPTEEPEESVAEGREVSDDGRKPQEVRVSDGFQVAPHLQLQLPEFEDPKKYEELFRALKKHLLS